ncbi:hypothetical protein CKM354_000971400 [Cercospora kikuchii]|uniref:Peptidase S9 prolyl oligopeptidase catalytic domain-containing protein n=1 Tax=Cercospora kikuchii TaxID=84275 RepID=A0A9P3CPJ8_9PEZI|nr:uncharacterized protein CKM354_000971400 [Cercospora kikuchii]GIZ46594.1 hypothetical protein CKM354_000971400 [Cercospora kikuchii]
MLLISSLYSLLAGYRVPLQAALNEPAANAQSLQYRFSEDWSVLGPFQVGTREALWGADPFEHHGGFRSLQYDENAAFPSSLAVNGTVGWKAISGNLTQPDNAHTGVELMVDFNNVDWESLRNVYGWVAYQWQAWLRGEIVVQPGAVKLLTLHTPQILEFVLDDVRYVGGDFYSYGRALPTLRLEPGRHRLDIRLVRDVRSMGGVERPSLRVDLALAGTWAGLHPRLERQNGVLISDVLEFAEGSHLASPWASVVLRNDDDVDIYVYAVEATHNACLAEMLSETEIRLVPGQSRPIAFRVDCVRTDWQIRLDFKIRRGGLYGISLTVLADVVHRRVGEPHKVTFLHPSGIVSYAILRPPSANAIEAAQKNDSLPVLLGLHGAGVEAEWDSVRLALQPLPDLAAWVLLPTGGTPWSGDDWHAWGFPDVQAALKMIINWIQHNEWEGPGVDVEKWLVAGHSNGGQGTWYTLLHHPDNIIAAAPLSGYSSIQNYVPYTFWQIADPSRTAVVQASLNSYRHELLLSNAKDIPVLQQHGGADDNVPAYHSRSMHQYIHEAGANSTYIEWPGFPHFWEGVFTTDPLRAFYQEQLESLRLKNTRSSLCNFTLTVASPADTGPKFGVKVLQLTTPGQLGHAEMLYDAAARSCTLRTTNIRMLQIPSYFGDCSGVILDSQRLDLPRLGNGTNWIVLRLKGEWSIEQATPDNPASTKLSRLGRQLGQLDSILRTQGVFQIVEHSPEARHIALQISRNLCQYFAADTAITSDYDAAVQATGNIISVAIGDDLPAGLSTDFAIKIQNGRISIRNSFDLPAEYTDDGGYGVAAIFLRPLPHERLELVVWGIDEASLEVAARLVPMIPGTAQPDWLVTDQRMLAKGLEGVHVMGFFDSEWEVSRNSFLS